ncbi:hypothetical protein EYF80_014379 [Liparis tanakae]|uniref:Uncharacterized protein n=1 Tax=Liparis tanakae TaxID=230148 RepID=A0A4Z2IDE7_9TELE|nr:hypothetical protein EYF80_014379 [Liparis tanakae]
MEGMEEEMQPASTAVACRSDCLPTILSGDGFDGHPRSTDSPHLNPRKAIQFSDFIIREVNSVKLVQSRSKIFKHWNFITYGGIGRLDRMKAAKLQLYVRQAV